MTDQDFQRFAALWAQAWEVCGAGRMPTREAIVLAFDVLRDWPLEAIRQALIAHMRDPRAGAYPPKPADVIRHLEGGHEEEREARALVAWRRVMDTLASVGRYASVVFDDPAIHHAVEVAFGGWTKLADTPEDELRFRKRDFVRAYCAFRPRSPYPARLVGEWEARASDGARWEVAYIGDTERARAVEAHGRMGGEPVAVSRVVAQAIPQEVAA